MLYNGSNVPFALDFGTINTGQTVSQTISVTIDPAFTGTTLTNYVEITADDGDDNDSTTNNQSDDEDDDDTAVVTLTTNAVCGNGIPEAGEQCGEPGLTCSNSSQSCNNSCQCDG
jgi:hypothetical protein